MNASEARPADPRNVVRWVVYNEDAPYPANERLVASVLLHRLSFDTQAEEWNCFLRQRRLALESGLSLATVKRALGGLVRSPRGLFWTSTPGRTRGRPHECLRFTLQPDIAAMAIRPPAKDAPAAILALLKVRVAHSEPPSRTMGSSQRAARVAHSEPAGGSERATDLLPEHPPSEEDHRAPRGTLSLPSPERNKADCQALIRSLIEEAPDARHSAVWFRFEREARARGLAFELDVDELRSYLQTARSAQAGAA